ncbi:MAG: aslB [Firmicutes bacterium]|nr:aslB [Bacillota bacterium]
MEQVRNIAHILAKPIGPQCNLNCGYCFYTEKSVLYRTQNFRMADEVLETYIRKYIAASKAPEVSFVWQGGEPTLLGVDFFRKAISLQRRYAGDKRIVNSLQTNGTLLDDEWCGFLKDNDFLVGISLDGPADIHDRYRLSQARTETFTTVLKGFRLLKEYDIPFNVLCCVTKESAYQAKEIYQFFKYEGIKFIQFIPIVERQPDAVAIELGLRHGMPGAKKATEVTLWSVEAEEYGDFLITIFDEWVRNDVGTVHVMNFEWALEAWLGLEATVCVFAKQCGEALVMEHDGTVYSCDHYVYPEYQLGNILTSTPEELVQSQKQRQFGLAKKEKLPAYCRNCAAEFACHGECPKHRFLQTPDGEEGLNYLCAGYKRYFQHIHPYMKVIRQLIENNLPPAKVMDVIKGPLIVKGD